MMMSSTVAPSSPAKPRAHRKTTKPLMERRRRARINSCLAQLRTLLIQTHGAQGCLRSRMEKADILELTVRHVKSLTIKNKGQLFPNSDAALWSQFCSGYTDCARDARSFFRNEGHPCTLTFHHPLTDLLSLRNSNALDLSNGSYLFGKAALPELHDKGTLPCETEVDAVCYTVNQVTCQSSSRRPTEEPGEVSLKREVKQAVPPPKKRLESRRVNDHSPSTRAVWRPW